MTNLLDLTAALHRAHQHGIVIVPGALETVDWIVNVAARRVTIAQHLGMLDWAAAAVAGVAELLPEVSAEVTAEAVGDGTTGAAGVVVPLRPPVRPLRAVE